MTLFLNPLQRVAQIHMVKQNLALGFRYVFDFIVIGDSSPVNRLSSGPFQNHDTSIAWSHDPETSNMGIIQSPRTVISHGTHDLGYNALPYHIQSQPRTSSNGMQNTSFLHLTTKLPQFLHPERFDTTKILDALEFGKSIQKKF